MSRLPPAGLAALATAALALAGCGEGGGANGRPVTVKVGWGASQRLVGELYAQGLANAGYRVVRRPGLPGPREAQAALRAGRIDVYPVQLGLGLTALARQRPAPGTTADDAFGDLESWYADRRDTLLRATPFSESVALAVRANTAARLSARTLSAARARASAWAVAAPRGCERSPDCLGRIERVYRLDFGRVVAASPAAAVRGLRAGRFDVAVLATGEPRLAGGRLVLLRDDRHALPPENIAPATSDAVLHRAGPDLRTTLIAVSGKLPAPIVQQLGAKVELEGVPLERVVREFLRDNGLGPGSSLGN